MCVSFVVRLWPIPSALLIPTISVCLVVRSLMRLLLYVCLMDDYFDAIINIRHNEGTDIKEIANDLLP